MPKSNKFSPEVREPDLPRLADRSVGVVALTAFNVYSRSTYQML